MSINGWVSAQDPLVEGFITSRRSARIVTTSLLISKAPLLQPTSAVTLSAEAVITIISAVCSNQMIITLPVCRRSDMFEAAPVGRVGMSAESRPSGFTRLT